MAKEKEITNNELLEMMVKQFNKIDLRFDNLESRFDNLESRFDNLESRFDNLESRFDKLTIKVINIEEALKEKADRKELIEFKVEILTALDKLSKKHENHETEHIANLGAHRRMQKEINDCRGKLGLKASSLSV